MREVTRAPREKEITKMTGTAKQIAWAEDIIKSANRALDCMIRNAERAEKDNDKMFDRNGREIVFDREDVETLRTMLNAQFESWNDAKLIIDNRNRFQQHYFEAAAAEIHKSK